MLDGNKFKIYESINQYRSFIEYLLGEVAEWFKANDSKSFNSLLFVGSNPTLSVFSYRQSVVRDSQIVQDDWYD